MALSRRRNTEAASKYGIGHFNSPVRRAETTILAPDLHGELDRVVTTGEVIERGTLEVEAVAEREPGFSQIEWADAVNMEEMILAQQEVRYLCLCLPTEVEVETVQGVEVMAGTLQLVVRET